MARSKDKPRADLPPVFAKRTKASYGVSISECIKSKKNKVQGRKG